ncbi:hypothetical protein BJP36_42545 [Moorena producens JHB]|uniref:Uncharacterized protein n=1 Tax=Moorena producens (strain JHB) TaxID=1454205 RepID=A0A9Q9SSW1_MOOP1|nr:MULTISPECIES: hypothetical protein [Moorena]NEQ06627.1 hypothetical protein [Moorena sp. SIO4E2]WAN69038.1 hypothetical protein BJP36_42545 [Moorena producens JHB]
MGEGVGSRLKVSRLKVERDRVQPNNLLTLAYWPRDREQPNNLQPVNLGLLATRSRSTF